MKVKELMRRDVEVLAPSATLKEAAQRMADSDAGSLPVLLGGKLVGVITDRDIVVSALAEGLKPGETTVASIMTSDVVCCQDEDAAEIAVDLMTKRKVERVLVLNDAGEFAGIVSRDDLATWVSEETPSRTEPPRPRPGTQESLSFLIKDELAAAETYRQALETIRGPGADELRRIETEHEEAALILSERMKGLGGLPPTGAGLWGAWARTIEDSERFFEERAILKILKLGEEQGAADYARALKSRAIEPELHELILNTLMPKTLLHASAISRLLQTRAGP